tara:strand:- start:775 stop:1200 length:426 start_codon:yes stop_codon:yes gene_type:complete
LHFFVIEKYLSHQFYYILNFESGDFYIESKYKHMNENLTIVTNSLYPRPIESPNNSKRSIRNWFNLFYSFVFNRNYLITREHDLLLDYHLRYNNDQDEIVKLYPNIENNIKEYDIHYDKANIIEEMHFLNAPKRIIDRLGI